MSLGRDTTFTWYGHACLEIRTPGGKTILVYPWFSNPKSPKTIDRVDRCDVLRVTHGHLHGVLRGPVENQIVDHGAHDHAAAHELPDRVANVRVVTPETVHPPDNESVPAAKEVEQATALGTVGKACADA